jgi:hypothetical protein
LVVPRCVGSHESSFTLFVVGSFSRISYRFVLMSQNARLEVVSLSVFTRTVLKNGRFFSCWLFP